MKQRICFSPSLCCLVTAGLVIGSSVAAAQAAPTATRRLQPSAFVMVDGVLTGLEAGSATGLGGGRNVAITAGGDLGVYTPGRYSLAVEIRGSYPISSGVIVGEKSALAGVRFSREPPSDGFFHRVRPYVDVLFGRGQMEYGGGGYYVPPNLLYFQSNSNILDGGGGIEVDVTRSFSLKVDAQVQRWKTPVLPDGSVYTKQAGAGLTYRFGAGAGPR